MYVFVVDPRVVLIRVRSKLNHYLRKIEPAPEKKDNYPQIIFPAKNILNYSFGLVCKSLISFAVYHFDAANVS
jgi:hypothetical protein